MEEMDFSHSSRKSWDLLRKLGSAQPTRKEHGTTANAVAKKTGYRKDQYYHRLSPTLFNVYTADIEATNSRKFIYADDIGLVGQGTTFEQLEEILNKDLDVLQNYFKNWHLNLNANKTTAVAFHLNNRETNRELEL